MSFIKEMYVRLRLETPPFFRRLFAYLMLLSTACATTLTGESIVNSVFKTEVFPEWTIEPMKYVCFAGFVAGIICKLAVTRPEEITPAVRKNRGAWGA